MEERMSIWSYREIAHISDASEHSSSLEAPSFQSVKELSKYRKWESGPQLGTEEISNTQGIQTTCVSKAVLSLSSAALSNATFPWKRQEQNHSPALLTNKPHH